MHEMRKMLHHFANVPKFFPFALFFTERRHVSGSGAARENKHRIKSTEILLIGFDNRRAECYHYGMLINGVNKKEAVSWNCSN